MARAGQHRGRLVQSAIRLFRQKGYTASGLAEILALSGAPKGSLYHYFPGGKEEIGAAAVRVAGQVVDKTLAELVEQTATPREFIAAYCGKLAGWIEVSDFRDGCPIATILLETTPHSALITAAGREVFESWTDRIAEVFTREGIEKPEAHQRAQLLICTVEGALLLSRVLGDASPLRNIRAEYHAL